MLKEREIKSTWQYSELRQFLEQNHNDPELDFKTVFLVNPGQRKEVDQIISNHLWPGVLKGVGSSGIWIKALDSAYPKSAIEEEKHPYATRALTFLLEDPKRQLPFNNQVPWYCRGRIQCSLSDYMISFDFYVYFPATFSLKKLVRLLKNPEFSACPPELSYYDSPLRDGAFSLAFTKGRGAGWGLHSPEQAAIRIKDEVKQNIEVIKAVYALENDYNGNKEFRDLKKALVAAFGEKHSTEI